LSGLARTLAVENAMHGITVNTLNLGYMSIGMIDTIAPGLRDNIRLSVPMGRLGDVKNVAEAIRFLVAADYVTGTEITIDGGWLCS
jgi:3-oxoacyl-[acyl-carrier protein] reductase